VSRGDRHVRVRLRRARTDDVAAIGAIAIATGQSAPESAAQPQYVHHLLAHGEVVVATDQQERVVGFGATRAVAGVVVLSDLFVTPDNHARGVGRAILTELWTEPAAARLTFSSQHPSALPLYASFGVRPFWPLLYLTGERRRVTPREAVATTVPWQEAAAAEQVLTGIDRAADYRYWAADPPRRAVVISLHGQPVGAAALSESTVLHLACESAGVAAEVLLAAIDAFEAERVHLALPGPHPALATLLGRGFRITDSDTYMSTDPELVPSWSAPSASLA
jgi:GNAT superfamily N-acetyltransferase